VCAFVIGGTGTGGFIFDFVLHIAKVFTSWSDTRLKPDVVGTPFSLEAPHREFFCSVYAENLVGVETEAWTIKAGGISSVVHRAIQS
jgi:hypothetical protein